MFSKGSTAAKKPWVIEGAVKTAGYEIPKFSRKHPEEEMGSCPYTILASLR
jgi:hypothetical protein